MRNTFKKTTLSLALATGLIGSAAWSTDSHACAAEPLVSSICVMAAVSLNGDFGGGVFAVADGRLLPISQNTALYSLVGQTYGGSGQVTFGIPDLRGRVVMGSGRGPGLPQFNAGETYGALTTVLTTAQMPAHNHTASANSTSTTTLDGTLKTTASLLGVDSLANSATLGGNSLAQPSLTGRTPVANGIGYSTAAPTVEMNPSSLKVVVEPGSVKANTSTATTVTVGINGGGAAVSLMQPSLVLNYYIAVNGIYPTRN